MKRGPAEIISHPVGFAQAMALGRCRGYVAHVTDGDTVDVFIDLGFNCYRYDVYRVLGIDAPELDTPEGKTARNVAASLIYGQHVLVRAHPDTDKYGRYLTELQVFVPAPADDQHKSGGIVQYTAFDFGARMVELGQARPYDGGPRGKS